MIHVLPVLPVVTLFYLMCASSKHLPLTHLAILVFSQINNMRLIGNIQCFLFILECTMLFLIRFLLRSHRREVLLMPSILH